MRRLLWWRRPGPPSTDLPSRFGRYRIHGRLGEGGMGIVWEAEDETLQRRVALKTMKSRDRASRKRFLHEARAAARVSHPNLCPIFEVGEVRGQPFLTMELLSGDTLAARLRRGPLPPAEALGLGEDLLAALSALHEADLVHRDIKPSNIFLTPHGAKVVDFGLAQVTPKEMALAVKSSSDLELPGMIVGTPGYMAPEQILGRDVDARADVFSAGAVLYEALAGRPPFGGALAASLSATLYDDPLPVGDTPVLAALDGAFRKALAKKAADRFSSARDAADALRAAARAAAAAPGPGREAFVGRRAELQILEERFASAVAGSGGIVFLTGERGVGKSTLVGEFMRRVRKGTLPVTVVAGRCTEAQGPGEAFQPFLDASGRLLTSHARDYASELLRTYAPTVGIQMPGAQLLDPDGSLRRQAAGASKERLIREAGDFMEAACRAFPILLFMDDLQWADPASVDMLHHLGCRLARQRTLIVAAFRAADVEGENAHLKRCVLDLRARGAAHELALPAFSREDVVLYLEARLPRHRLPDTVAEALHARSEGLPLFVRSLVDLLVERGEVVHDDGRFVLAHPEREVDLAPTKGLQDLARDHLAGLPRPEREVLEAASVCGREFLSPVVAHLVGRKERRVEEDLRRLARHRNLIVETREEVLPDGTPALRYRFAHALYAEILSGDLLPSRRHELHRAAAAQLCRRWGQASPQLAAEIARHGEEGRDYPRAIEFRSHAGDNAARRFAYAEAEEHYDWAFRWVQKLPLAEQPSADIALRQRRGSVRLAQARFDLAAEDFGAMRDEAQAAGDAEAERLALAGLCDAHFFAQKLPEMAAEARRLLEVSTRAGSEGAVAEAQARQGQLLVAQGRLDEAIPALEAAIAGGRRTRALVALKIALVYRALVHYFHTEYEAAEVASVESATLAREQGDGFHSLAAWMFTGLARAGQGRLSEALDDFLDATAAARRNDNRYWLPRLLSHSGWVHRELGALDRAREYDSEALQLARERPVWGSEAEALLNLSVDAFRAGRADEGAALLSELEASASENTLLKWLNELRVASASAEHWSVRGDHARAAGHAATLRAVARRVGARDFFCAGARMRAQAALAQGAGLEEAAADLEEALRDLSRGPAPMEISKSARTLALVRRRQGDETGARAAFIEAAQAVKTMAAGTRDEALRARYLSLPWVREILEGAAPGSPQ